MQAASCGHWGIEPLPASSGGWQRCTWVPVPQGKAPGSSRCSHRCQCPPNPPRLLFPSTKRASQVTPRTKLLTARMAPDERNLVPAPGRGTGWLRDTHPTQSSGNSSSTWGTSVRVCSGISPTATYASAPCSRVWVQGPQSDGVPVLRTERSLETNRHHTVARPVTAQNTCTVIFQISRGCQVGTACPFTRGKLSPS